MLSSLRNKKPENVEWLYSSGGSMFRKFGSKLIQTVMCFDVMFTASGTETVALKQSDGSYKLYGYKWFSSATDADMALTLARDCDEHGHCTEVCHAVCVRCHQA